MTDSAFTNEELIQVLRNALTDYDAPGTLGQTSVDSALSVLAERLQAAEIEVERLGMDMYENCVPKGEANARIVADQELMGRLCRERVAEVEARLQAAETERDEAIEAFDIQCRRITAIEDVVTGDPERFSNENYADYIEPASRLATAEAALREATTKV